MRAIVLASTALVLCSPAYAYDPVADTRKIMASTVTTKSIQTEYLTGKRDGTTVFKRVQAAYVAIRTAEAAVTPVPAWKACAPEGGTCTLKDPANVRYGAGSTWVERQVTGAIACTNAAFGRDPAPNVVKACETTGTVAAPAPVPTPSPIAAGGLAKATGNCVSEYPFAVLDDGRPVFRATETGKTYPVIAKGWSGGLQPRTEWALDLGSGAWAYIDQACLVAAT